MLEFLNTDGTQIIPTESVQVGGDRKIIPEGTKLLCRINGVTINPESKFNYIHIGVDTTVIQEGEYKGIEKDHKLHVNGRKIREDEENIPKAEAASARKKSKDQVILLTYDKLSRGEIKDNHNRGVDVMDVGILNRALAGLDFTATFGTFPQAVQEQNTSGNWVDTYDELGKKVTRDVNFISGVENKSVALALIAEDANINQQAQNQPNAPQIDPVNLQPSTPSLPQQQQAVQQPQASQPSIAGGGDIPF